MIASIGSLLKGMLYGAGLMYFLDPDRGRRRRAGAMDRAVHLTHQAEQLWNQGCRDLRNRSRGLAAEARRTLSLEPVDDQQLIARVRATLGHSIEDARPVEVVAHDGIVTLRGTVRPGEPERLIPTVENIPGVRAVESTLTTAGEPAPSRASSGMLTPASRMLLTTGGGLLVLNCLLRRGFGPTCLGVAGAGMIARSLTDRPGGFWKRTGDDASGVEASIRIHAPVEKVFDFVSDLDQSAHLLSDALQIESLGGGRLKWSIDGPGGVGRIAGIARQMESIENERLVWANEGDSPLRYLKEVRFRPEGDSTCLDVRAVYELPGGRIGVALAALVGRDPRSQLHRTLNRIKHHLEDNAVGRETSTGTVREHRG